jgi:hypothetical protein
MKTISFNTGRLYSQNGQQVVAAMNDDGVCYFYDRSRMIDGWITRRLPRLTPEAVMLNYDANNYAMSWPDMMSMSDATMISDAACALDVAPLSASLKM